MRGRHGEARSSRAMDAPAAARDALERGQPRARYASGECDKL